MLLKCFWYEKRVVSSLRACAPNDFCNPEFCSNASGFLVPYGNAQAAADAVITLINNPELQKSFGEHARKELTTRFSYQKHFNNIEELYKLILR